MAAIWEFIKAVIFFKRIREFFKRPKKNAEALYDLKAEIVIIKDKFTRKEKNGKIEEDRERTEEKVSIQENKTQP